MTFIYSKSFPFATLLLYDSAVWENSLGAGWKFGTVDKLDYYPSIGAYLLSAFSGQKGNDTYKRLTEFLQNHEVAIIDIRKFIIEVNTKIEGEFQALLYIPISFYNIGSAPKAILGRVIKIPSDISKRTKNEYLIFPDFDLKGIKNLLREIRGLNRIYTSRINPVITLAGFLKLPVVKPEILVTASNFVGLWGASIIKKNEETESFNRRFVAYPFRFVIQLFSYGVNGLPYDMFSNLGAPIVIDKKANGEYVATDHPIFEPYYFKGECLKGGPDIG